MLNIPIVIAAYNRKGPLQRLLGSLEKAVYPVNVKLIISIDGGDDNGEIVDMADRFEWSHGEKEIIKHKKNIGLRKHIISCGQLSKIYDGIILLEDDLFVAPYFYDYTLEVQSKYSSEVSIAGVALYSHQYNETACLPFTAISDEYDVFFLQLACSWGQSWLSQQWSQFEDWYFRNSALVLSNDPAIPNDVRIWPETSWKKYYIKYLIETNKYFVYPRTSQVTNFGDAGQHHHNTKILQVPLQYGKRSFNLPDFSISYAKYDSYCEMLPDCLKRLNKEYVEFDFDVDLYGIKARNELMAEYIITTQKIDNPIKCYGRSIKPHEVNVIENIYGNDIYFSKTEQMKTYKSFLVHRHEAFTDYEIIHKYYYPIRSIHYDKLFSIISRKDSEIEFMEHGARAYAKKAIHLIKENVSKIYRRIQRILT